MTRTVVSSVILLLLLCGSLLAEVLPRVTSVEIRGLKRIDEGAIRTKISQKIGEPVSSEKTNEDIKAIFKMGYFDDVKVEIAPFEGGVRLIYVLKEKPSIVRVDLQGNAGIDDAKIREKISITAGSIADTVLIQDNAVRIGKVYEEEGYWMTNVIPVVRKISDDEVSLTYQIAEGKKVKIRKIVIEGNSNLSAGQIKKTMETTEWSLLSLVMSTGYYRKDEMERDIDRIRNLYFNNGYLKIIVAEPEVALDGDKKGLVIKIRVSEGDQYKVASIEFTGNKVFDSQTIQTRITLAPNSVFRKNVLEKSMLAVSELYSQNGYALVTVVPDLQTDDAAKTVRISLRIDEGDKYRIGRIEISGNTKTRDKVIRREVRLDEGDTFNSALLKRSHERINNLNFFEGIDFAPRPNYEKKTVDLDIRVKEKPTGFLSIGGGYSSVDKFIGTVDLTQANLFGRGQYLKLKGEIGGKTTYYDFSFRDPWFLDKPLSFAAGIYKSKREYIEYDKDAFGLYVGVGKSLTEYWRVDVTYNFENATIENIDSGASSIIRDQEGTNTTSSISPVFIRDSRDNVIDPTRGSRNALYLTFAGIGGSTSFLRGSIDSGWYFPLGPTSFLLRGRFGYGTGTFGKELPLYERYYVGGINTVRGLGFGEAGPMDPLTGDPIGGTTELIFNTEFIFPILPEMRLKGLVFFDAGSSYQDFEDFGDLRYTTGLGLRWISPMGPIRLEWGYNLDRKPGESSSKFEFAFGSVF